MALPTVRFPASSSENDALQRACELWGISPEYWDMWGRRHVTTPEIARAILRSMRVACAQGAELDRSIEERLWQEWSRPLPATVVMGEERVLPLCLPVEAAEGCVALRIRFEDGSTLEWRYGLGELPETGRAELRGRHFVQKTLRLPGEVPYGYHRLEATLGDLAASCRLIACPDRTWTPKILENGGRTAGLAVSLYGLRSRRNWGCGDFTDLRDFIDWTAEQVGCSFVGLNPLHAIPNRQPYNTSPYLPNSVYYRNPLYLDVEALEDVQNTPRILSLIRSRRVQSQ